MSKRILLSLLMLLSLVFSSCKKSSGIMGPEPSSEINNSPGTTNGLVEDNTWLDENSEKPISNNEIPYFQTKAGDSYIRNPVIVVMGANKSDVVVFAEKRYKSSGSQNDIGIDGKTPADIVYISSTNSGKSWGLPQIAGRTAAAQADGKDAVASPVVFKINDNTVILVASAGAGLSRTTESYSKRNPKSQLRYAVGTYTDGVFNWVKEWEDMTEEITNGINKGIKGASGYSYQQFGTHAARGFVTNNDDNTTTLYLVVTVADQGDNSIGVKQVMGNIMFKGTYYQDHKVYWKLVEGSGIGFTTVSGGNSGYKESTIVGINTSGKIQYIAVANPLYYNNGGLAYGLQGKQPKYSGMDGSEGSPSYLIVSNWQGIKSYDPAGYSNEGGKVQGLYAHVRGLNNQIAMYGVNPEDFTKKGNEYIIMSYPQENTYIAKSSSMDILGDGTIVMAAEQGGKEREYYIVFKRFTQKFLAVKLGIN